MQRISSKFSLLSISLSKYHNMYKHIIVLSLLGALINANLIGWRNCGKI